MSFHEKIEVISKHLAANEDLSCIYALLWFSKQRDLHRFKNGQYTVLDPQNFSPSSEQVSYSHAQFQDLLGDTEEQAISLWLRKFFVSLSASEVKLILAIAGET